MPPLIGKIGGGMKKRFNSGRDARRGSRKSSLVKVVKESVNITVSSLARRGHLNEDLMRIHICLLGSETEVPKNRSFNVKRAGHNKK